MFKLWFGKSSLVLERGFAVWMVLDQQMDRSVVA